MYNFTSFAMSLNELQPGMEAILAPTDCRLRPDIRAMENGDISECLIYGLDSLQWFMWQQDTILIISLISVRSKSDDKRCCFSGKNPSAVH